MRAAWMGGALAIGLVACSGAEGTSAPTCDPAPGSLQPSALTPNGLSTNGLSTNGLSTNGLSTNGLSTNGVQLNGIAVGAVSVQGLVLGSEAAVTNGARSGASTAMLVGTELVVLSGGTTVRGAALAGAKLLATDAKGASVDLSIGEVVTQGDLVSYRLLSNGAPVCSGTGTGLFVQGAWDARAARVSDTAISFSCDNGAITKCVRLGYRPWSEGPEVHQACMRMIRADYCGDGTSWTREGTKIDVYDSRGIQKASGAEGFLFEAAWGENGATCVARTRYEMREPDGTVVVPSCWSTLPKCTEGSQALVANLSPMAVRNVCR